jgi:hypothetical protein
MRHQPIPSVHRHLPQYPQRQIVLNLSLDAAVLRSDRRLQPGGSACDVSGTQKVQLGEVRAQLMHVQSQLYSCEWHTLRSRRGDLLGVICWDRLRISPRDSSVEGRWGVLGMLSMRRRRDIGKRLWVWIEEKRSARTLPAPHQRSVWYDPRNDILIISTARMRGSSTRA